MISSRPHKPTACELPHFTKGGEPRAVAGQVYRWSEGSQVMCIQHGKELIERIQAEAAS